MFRNRDNVFTVEELEELFNDEVQQETPPAEEPTEPQSEVQTEDDKVEDTKSNNVEQTKAFAKRLRESTDKARNEEREAIAKSFGYESYEAMMQERQRKLIEDKGLDPEDVTPIVDKIVEQRINEDPRMKELESFRKQSIAEYGKRELAEITELTGGRITRLDQLPRNVLDLWRTKGSLKAAYLELEGANLIKQIRMEQSRGTTNHMNTPSANTQPPTNQRPLNADEKRMWKLFNPNISDEELNKKTVNK
jgi:hypothetical protein